GQEQLQAYYESYERAVRQRAGTVRELSRISPSALMQYAGEEVAGTGLPHEARFLGDVHAYSAAFDGYVLRKTGTLVGTSYWSFGTMIELNGKSVFIHSPQPLEYRGNTSDFPRFAESPRRSAEGLLGALPDVAGLLAWNIVLALLAFGTIQRMDVR
ncbi:MAG TPA: DUF3526 domain-containing protein, partial [Bacteroidota bacterium]|nr:DUF3526 domain-containing protein [Bacteroidota bacterium]